MSTAVERAWRLWLRAMRAWHRYAVEGVEHVTAPGAKLVAAYHGRGLPLDLALLSEEVRLRAGYLPRQVVHEGLWKVPGMPALLDAAGCVPGDGPSLRAAVARGEAVVIAPGGTHEGLRTWRERHTVDWGRRRGYLRFAHEHGLPIVPVASAGVDDRFIGLNHGHALGRRLRLPARWPLWFALGPLGLYPFTPDFPVTIRTRVGPPLALDPGDPGDPAWLDAQHRRVTAAVQSLLDRPAR